MRINLPLTRHGCPFASDQTLVSVTDLKGRNTCGHPAFVDISGYSREELPGRPHNLVRHPDMPQETFRDLWETIQSVRPGSGRVLDQPAISMAA